MSVPDRGLNTTAAILHGIAPPAWTEAVAPAHGWDLAFAYAVSLLAWLHLLLPLASMLCGFGIALTGIWLYTSYQEGAYILLTPVLLPYYCCLRLYNYRRDMRTIFRLSAQVRGRYLGLVTGLFNPRAVMDALGTTGMCLCTACKLRCLLSLVSWQEAVGLMGLLGWAVAALTPNMWTCFPGGDTLAWLRMQLALTLEGARLGGSGQHIIAGFFFFFCFLCWPSDLLKRRREMLSRRNYKRYLHHITERAKEQQVERQAHAAAGDSQACNAIALKTNKKAAPPKPPRLRAAPDEALHERLGLPALTNDEVLGIYGFAMAAILGICWVMDPTMFTSYWLCKYTSWYWSLSWTTTALCLWLPLLVIAIIASQAIIYKAWSEWDSAYRAYKYDLQVSMQGFPFSQKDIDALARTWTERSNGPEPSGWPLVLDWAFSFARWAIGLCMGLALVVWALRPGYLPAQVVGAWPWQGPQPWVGAAKGGSAPVCYKPGWLAVVNHPAGLPPLPALWQAARASVRELGVSNATTDSALPPECMHGDAGQDIELLGVCDSELQLPVGPPPMPPLVAGERHAAVGLSWDTVLDVWHMDWFGYLARAARVNLLAARAWRHRGLEGVRGAFNALRVLQAPGANHTIAAAALVEIKRLQLPKEAADAPGAKGSAGASSAEPAAPAAEGGGGSGSGARPGKRRRNRRRKVQRPEVEGEGEGSSAGVEAAAAAVRGAEERDHEEDTYAEQQSTGPAPAGPSELALDAASSLHQHLMALALAVVVTPLLLAAQARWDLVGMVMKPERLAEAVMLGVAWVLDVLLWMMGQSEDGRSSKAVAGASGAKRTTSGKPKGKQQQVQVERQGSGKEPQARQQEQKQKQGARGGKETAAADRQQQERQAKTPAGELQVANGPKQQEAAGEAARQEASAAGAKAKGGPVRQPTAVATPSSKSPRDRQREGETQAAAGGDKGSVGSKTKKQQQRPQQLLHKQGAAAQPPPPRTGRTVSAADAVAALFPFTAELAASNSSRSKAAANGDYGHSPAPPTASAPAAALPQHPARPSSSFTPAAPVQALPPPTAAPRPAPVPVNPRAVRPATFQDIMGGRLRTAPQQPSSTATTSSHPGVPVPIPVISGTSSGLTPPLVGPPLIPRGPNGMPTPPPAAAAASAAPAPSPMGRFGFNPALANYLMGRTASPTTTANDPTAAQAAGALNPTDAKQQQEAAAAVAGGAGAASGGAVDPHKCIRCRTGARQVGFLHGDSAHVCMCRGCSSALGLRDGDPCPQCNLPCVRVLNIF